MANNSKAFFTSMNKNFTVTRCPLGDNTTPSLGEVSSNTSSTSESLSQMDLTLLAFYAKLSFSVYYNIIPVVSTVGIVGNVLSILVLYRHGLRRSSFILLIALALADTLYLLGTNNIPGLIYRSRTPQGYYFSREISYFLYIWDRACVLMSGFGRCCSLTLPVLITFERLICVFFPFRFSKIVTVQRRRGNIQNSFIKEKFLQGPSGIRGPEA